ncbi:unnamed protein product [Brachionus calyciflorus]|uniref:EGF-like domain-containing protein n=1 Tax=Brachionus calyciflorus TaxID=104777 RepID=A0A813S3L7_9BILA|nr:unnamed protein product [Brachionus calyciflorus]
MELNFKNLLFAFTFSCIYEIVTSQTTIVFGLENGTIIVWDFEINSILYTLSGHNSEIRSLENLPGNYLASGDKNGQIIIWNISEKSNHRQLFHDKDVASIILINKSTFASASSNSIKFWSLESFTNIFTINDSHSSEIIGLKYFSNSLFSISSDGILKSWENYTEKFQFNTSCEVLSFEIILNEILACGCSDGHIKFYSVESNSFNFIKSLQRNITVLCLRDLKAGLFAIGMSDGYLELFNYNRNMSIVSYQGHNKSVNMLEYIENRGFLSGSNDGTIKMWYNMTMIKYLNIGLKIMCLKYLDPLILTARTDMFSGGKITRNTSFSITTQSFNSTFKQIKYTTKNLAETFQATNTNYFVTKYLNPTLIPFVIPTSSYSHDITLKNDDQENNNLNDLLNDLFNAKDFQLNSINLIDLNILLSNPYDLTDCLSNCSNQGMCYFDIEKFKCICNENYYGSSCNLDLRPCSSNPCLNNGTCSNVKVNENLNYKCQCIEEYYSGNNCEIKKDICLNETCSNNGQCYDLNHMPKCKCFNMFSGEKCEMETNYFTIIKNVNKTTTIIACLIISSLFALCLMLDIFSVCCNAKNSKHKKQSEKYKIQTNERIKLVYMN